MPFDDGAVEGMAQAVNASVPGTEERAWLLVTLGHLLVKRGSLDSAERIYRGALEERPGYAHALGGLADVKTARGDHDDAVRLLEEARSRSNDHGLLEKLSLAYRAMGDSLKSAELAQEVLLEFREHEEEGWMVDLEFARYLCKASLNLDEALTRARHEYERRPDNIEVLDLLAWALYLNGKGKEAVSYIERAMRLGSTQPEMLMHAGMIYASVGCRYQGKHDNLRHHSRSSDSSTTS